MAIPGAWLSWLERRVHIAEIAGSSPAAPRFSSFARSTARITLGRESRSILTGNRAPATPSGIGGGVPGDPVLMEQTDMTGFRLSSSVAVALLLTGTIYPAIAEECIRFISPVTGSAITTAACTLMVERVKCRRNIQKIEFQARYFPAGKDSSEIISIGSVSRSPYTIVWDISEIPNQLFSGASFFAEATMTNGDLEAIRREGVFFLHQEVTRPVAGVPFNFDNSRPTEPTMLNIAPPRSDVTIGAWVYWSSNNLIVHVDVKDPHFRRNLSRDELAATGIEILLDPALSRRPFPGQDVFIYSVPLNGKPYRTMYRPIPDDSGSFAFETSMSPCDFAVSVSTNDRQGFSIYCPIPITTIGTTLPDSLGFNLVVKTVSGKKTERSSWVTASLYETYSPYIWGALHLEPRPEHMNRLLIAGVLFGVGFFITLLIAAIVMLFSRPVIKTAGVRSEDERQQFAAIKEVLDGAITGGSVTLDAVARAVGSSPKKVSLLIRRATGMNIQAYIMFFASRNRA
jgi:hypothetical protein